MAKLEVVDIITGETIFLDVLSTDEHNAAYEAEYEAEYGVSLNDRWLG